MSSDTKWVIATIWVLATLLAGLFAGLLPGGFQGVSEGFQGVHARLDDL